MALRHLATRMRNPAAAALRVLPPAPRAAPPAGTRPRFYVSQVSYSSPEDRARKLLKKNIAMLGKVKQHYEYMRSSIWWITKGGKCLCWSFKLLSPVPVVVAIAEARSRG